MALLVEPVLELLREDEHPLRILPVDLELWSPVWVVAFIYASLSQLFFLCSAFSLHLAYLPHRPALDAQSPCSPSDFQPVQLHVVRSGLPAFVGACAQSACWVCTTSCAPSRHACPPPPRLHSSPCGCCRWLNAAAAAACELPASCLRAAARDNHVGLLLLEAFTDARRSHAARGARLLW